MKRAHRAQRRLARAGSLLALFSGTFAAACHGQQQQAARNRVDPALVAAVDSMLPRLEMLAGLKKLRPVDLAEQSRSQVRAYVEQRLQQELPPRELEGIRLTYGALGLIPDTLDLKALLIDLYQEQIAGYYDPVADKFYVVTGTAVGLLRPVLAHELVHALQDQHYDLDSLISRKRGNDRQSAAQAAIEGHATVVMFAFLAQQTTGQTIDPAGLPDIGAQLRPALEAQNSQFPVFRRAPRIIRETMIFPYVSGAEFVQKLWRTRKDGSLPAPLGPLLPQSTEQVLHADDHFLSQRDAPTEIRFTTANNAVYENTLGELETGILFSVYLGADTKSAAAGWDGDRYQITVLNGRNILTWQSVWDDAAAADRFADNYRRVAVKRPERSVRVERSRVQGREAVLIVDAPRDIDVNTFKAPGIRLTQEE